MRGLLTRSVYSAKVQVQYQSELKVDLFLTLNVYFGAAFLKLFFTIKRNNLFDKYIK